MKLAASSGGGSGSLNGLLQDILHASWKIYMKKDIQESWTRGLLTVKLV